MKKLTYHAWKGADLVDKMEKTFPSNKLSYALKHISRLGFPGESMFELKRTGETEIMMGGLLHQVKIMEVEK